MVNDLLLLMMLLLVASLGLVLVLVAVLLWVRSLRKRNRVSPGVATAAPVSWLSSPVPPARLHRRLRTAVAVARAATATAPVAQRLAELAAELEREAVSVDANLVVAAQIKGKPGKAHMAALAEQVRQVERMAAQVSMLAAQARAPMIGHGQPTALEDLARQLDLLEEARHEVAQVEAAAGVHRVSPYADPARPRPELRKVVPPDQAPYQA